MSRINAYTAGDLAADKVGGRWLIPTSEISRRQRLDTPRGRGYSPFRAWTFLQNPDPHELPALAPRLRRRAHATGYDSLPELDDDLLTDQRAVLGGVFAGHATERQSASSSRSTSTLSKPLPTRSAATTTCFHRQARDPAWHFTSSTTSTLCVIASERNWFRSLRHGWIFTSPTTERPRRCIASC